MPKVSHVYSKYENNLETMPKVSHILSNGMFNGNRIVRAGKHAAYTCI